ncbi:RDD family protein [Marinimicrobium alkaliphilum]|uniref:RDD family protein n=1 Tax=Marinimicrobium alkaliphilum TaxID=2202654 RepID=UPI000DB99BCD|nr:RDD family protein [Marinimicrobium alkaliphilum]
MTDTTTPAPLPQAGLLRRLAAMIYDGLLLIAVIMAYTGLVTWINHLLRGPLEDDMPVYPGLWGLVVFAGMIGCVVGFFCLFWRRSGQTLGMKSWRMVLVDDDTGKVPSLKRCLWRCTLAGLSFATLGLGYLWQWFDPERLALHDRLSRTRLLVVPKGR